jgi:ribosomal protein S12 methylthiotransferase accessory factor
MNATGATALASETVSPKRFRDGAHRVAAPADTLTRLLPLLPRFGITRVADVTGLDRIGIPVAMAVRPASRNLSVLQGKGATLAAAKVSAIMEAVESYSAEQPSPAITRERFGRWRDGGFLLPRQLLCRELDEAAAIPWVAGVELTSGEAVFVPEELVRTDFSAPPPPGYGWFLSGSNGLAAGNTRAEALVHAICELVERDARALWYRRPQAARNAAHIEPSSIADPAVAALLRALRDAGMIVVVWDITSDIGLPSFTCVIDDAAGAPPFLGRFGGSGCHTSAPVALARALAEAAQSRLTAIVGARDDIPPAYYAMIGWGRNAASLFGELPAYASDTAPSIAARSLDEATIDVDLAVVLECLRRAGIGRVVAVDLAHFGVPCVRVIAEGLEGQHEKPGYRPGPRALWKDGWPS